VAIEEGRRIIAEVGLENVELRQADVRELTDGSIGPFDYIIAHGVYGWIPADARDALLATIRASLAPGGIAYVSYNAEPGGYFRRMLRDAGLWHARDEQGEAAKAEKAQELYLFLKEHRVTSADTYGALLEREVPILADAPLYRLVHDDLAEHWYPVWFAEFAGHAARHGLGYVGEADMYSLRTEMLPDGVEGKVWDLAGGDRIAFENLSDVLTARHFRQSIMCRAGAPVITEPVPERAQRLHWSVRPNAEPYESGLLAEAFAELDRRRPHVVSFEELQATLGADPLELGAALLEGFRRERLMPHAGSLHAATEPGERPTVSRLARWQAANGLDMVSLAYMRVLMDEPAARLLITLLDGTRDRQAIIAELKARAGLELRPEDLDRNLAELARLFCLSRSPFPPIDRGCLGAVGSVHARSAGYLQGDPFRSRPIGQGRWPRWRGAARIGGTGLNTVC